MSRVLVVDDNADIRGVTARVLKHFGHHDVITAADGAEALKILERQRVDLVLLDLAMPGMDGLGVLERLRGANGRPRVPVLMFSAISGDRERRRALELGVAGFLTKTRAGPDELTSRIEECLAPD